MRQTTQNKFLPLFTKNKMNMNLPIPSPRVTIFIPTYNASRFIYETILSALNQEYDFFEILVVDDCSSDNTIKIINEFQDCRIKILKNQKNMGRPFTRNRGIESARGEFIAVLDADDIAEPDRLKIQIDFLEKNPDYAAVGSYANFIDESGNIIYLCKLPQSSSEIQKHILQYNCFIHSSVTFRKSILENVGGYNLNYPYAQDYELFLRLSENYKLFNIDKPLIKYRFHPDQVSQHKLKFQRKLANQARLESYHRRIQNSTLSKDIKKPDIGFFANLKGKEGTLSNDKINLSYTYHKLGKFNIENKLILSAIFSSPLNKDNYIRYALSIQRTKPYNDIIWFIRKIIKTILT